METDDQSAIFILSPSNAKTKGSNFDHSTLGQQANCNFFRAASNAFAQAGRPPRPRSAKIPLTAAHNSDFTRRGRKGSGRPGPARKLGRASRSFNYSRPPGGRGIGPRGSCRCRASRGRNYYNSSRLHRGRGGGTYRTSQPPSACHPREPPPNRRASGACVASRPSRESYSYSNSSTASRERARARGVETPPRRGTRGGREAAAGEERPGEFNPTL